MSNEPFYPIGAPGTPWNNREKKQWLKQSSQIQRSYHDDVVAVIHRLPEYFTILRYGALTYDPDRYQLYCLKSTNWDYAKPTVLITGGVHGYETSGVTGAIEFAAKHAEHYLDEFNFLIFPCISPWGYETINRWNPHTVDPNRSFYAHSPSEEAANLLNFIPPYLNKIVAHFDLHETTNSDESLFRPAAAARDGAAFHPVDIPDGFYLVADSERTEVKFQKAIIEAVSKVTHIAKADDQGRLFGTRLSQAGVVLYAMRPLGLCGGITQCKYHVTTEVYPDSKDVDDTICIQAQVVAIQSGLSYLMNEG
jgi:hypothetical protein